MVKKNKRKIWRKQDIPLYIMAAPTVILLILFSYLPMVWLIMAFKNFNVSKGLLGSEWVGFKNFEFLFASSDAWRITRNTVAYNVVFIFLNMILAVTLALMLSELHSRFMSKTLQTIFMMPYFLSWACVSIIVTAFLDRSNGMLNQIMVMFGGNGKTDWYKKIEIWPYLLTLVNAWKGVGYSAVLYIAVISGISREYYEAAVLDGATKFQQARYITIPHLRFVIAISLIMAMGSIFRGDFGLFYTVTKDTGALYPVTDVLDTYIYRGLMNLGNVGMTTAAGFYQSVVGLIAILIANKIVSKLDPDSAMF